VVRGLLALIEPQFEPATMPWFSRTVFHGAKSADVGAELGISVDALLLARPRITW
jgi:hypothetical protein